MAIEELNRTNIQSLYRYMPDQPFNWSSKAAVIGQTPRHASSLNVPEEWAKPQLRRLLRPFANASAASGAGTPELDVIERDRFALVKAEDLQATRFPSTFRCRTCGQFRAIRIGESATCRNGHGQMEQFPWVEIHECGHLKEITPPQCARHCRAPMNLLNVAAFKTSQWYWKCSRCNARSDQPVVRWCATCRQARAELIRIPQSRAYYPQQITLINPPGRGDYAALAHPNVHAAAVAQALGVLPPGVEGLRQAAGADVGGGAVETFKRTAEMLGWQPGSTLYEQGLRDAQAKEGAGPAWRDQVDALGLAPEALDAIGEECRQFSLAQSAAALTTDDLTADFAGHPLEPVYREYRSLFARYGLADIKLLRELPLAYIVAGYTRGSATATRSTRRGDTPVRFRFFPADRSGKFPMYGIRTETEGLLFQLDQLSVVQWLVDSGIISPPGVTTPQEAQRWLLTATDPVTDIFNPPENPVTRAVLGLTHSISHRVMKSLAARCGLNVDSLAEFLFPVNMAFLVYANTRSEFTLGGLEHVFRYDLKDALNELDAETRCVFDPPCRHSFGGACAACLHVSEVACARFNTVLDRNMLFGSIPAPGDDPRQMVKWRAYWNH
jgi:hypothetical protein